jgi:hypothetical protein
MTENMRKYTFFRFGRTYVRRDRMMAVKLLHGNRKSGYIFAVILAHPYFLVEKLRLQSRIILNDRSWIEVEMNAVIGNGKI